MFIKLITYDVLLSAILGQGQKQKHYWNEVSSNNTY